MCMIKSERKRLEMTQSQFAVLLGIPKYRVGKMENGGSLSLEDACTFCNAFPDKYYIKQMMIQRRDVN